MIKDSFFNCHTFEINNMDNIFDDDFLILPNETSLDISNFHDNLSDYNIYTFINNKTNNENKTCENKAQQPSNFNEDIKDKDKLKKIDDTYLNKKVRNTQKINQEIKSEKICDKNTMKNNNMKRKVKHLLINKCIEDINQKIKEVYNNNIGNGINEKKICKIAYSEIKKVDILSFKEFLNITLKDFLSLDISKKYSCYPSNFNKKVIESLLSEKNDEKRALFNNIFNQTFREWTQCLLRTKGELEGLFEEELKSKDSEILKYIIKNLEN